MANVLLEYQIRIRNKADSADLLTITSVRGGTNPWFESTPTGDGASFNPLTGESMCASYVARVVDGITSGTDRVVTAKLEDVAQRLQLGFLKAYVESRRDGGAWSVLCAGFLVSLKLNDALVWELNIQDASRVQGGVELFNAASSTTISSFLATWAKRGCLFGGPVIGGFLNNWPDLGGWQMKVSSMASGTRYWLKPLHVYGPPEWVGGRPDARFDVVADRVNAIAKQVAYGVREINGGVLPFSTIGDTYARGVQFPGIIYLIDGVPFRPMDPYQALRTLKFGDIDSGNLLSRGLNHPYRGAFAIQDGQTPLTDNSTVRVRCLSILPTEFAPIYIDSHPVDLLTTMWTAAGLAYDSSATASLKSTLGGGLRVTGRVTSSQQMGEFLREWAYGWAGIGVRTNASGQLVPFSTRIFSTSAPTKTITDALVVKDGQATPFEQDVTDGIARLTLRQKALNLAADSPDGVEERDVEITILNTDANALLSGTVDLTVPAMIRSDPSSNVPVDINWLRGTALQLFDRYGRGAQACERDLIRGDGTSDADTLNLGDEALMRTSDTPNHNKRYGDDNTVGGRAMQLVRVTELPDRRRVRFVDSGPNAQVATAPTISVAASSDLPRTVATVTITNAAALNASGYRVRIQMAVTTGAAPAAGDYADAYVSDEGAIPTGAITLPAVIAGRKVYVQARSEDNTLRASSYSAASSVTLTAIDAATALSAAAVSGDGAQEDLTWTPGSNATDCPIDIYVRASGAAFSTAVLRATLQPGSNYYRIEGLTPNTAYTASVQHRDPNTQDVSALTEVTFTTANSTRTLSAPTNPAGFSGDVRNSVRSAFGNAARNERYGIAVLATELPGKIEIAEAVETSVGAGTYGSFSTVGEVPAVSGEWTIWTGWAPNDRLRRQLKARHIGEGVTASSYTSVVTVSPWTLTFLPWARAIQFDDGLYPLQATESDGTTKSSTAIEPQGSTVPVPVDGTPFSYNTGGPSTGHMWIAWTWSAFNTYRPGSGVLAIAAASAMATPPSAVGRLSQVAGGALAGRTRFVRIGYVRDSKMYRIGAESSIVLSANNLLKVQAPSSVAGYDGWCVLISATTNTEVFQSEVPATATLAFGSDWTEPVGGATISGNTPYNSAMDNGVTEWGLNASTTYYYYPHYRLADSFVNFYSGGTSDTAQNALEAVKDQRIAFAATVVGTTLKASMAAATPLGGSTSSGSGGGKF